MQSKVKWIVAGELVGIIMIGALLAGPTILKANNNQTELPSAELSNSYRQALISPLNKATSEVKDPEIARFAQKLIQAYGLENTAANSNVDDASGLANLLPDVANIHKTAMNMPLIEAGKQIKDKELADFYNDFITRLGVGK